MKIGVLTSSLVGSKSAKSYNVQDIGLAKALSVYCDEVIVYRCVKTSSVEEKVTEKVQLKCIESRGIGSNGLFPMSQMDKEIDCLIHFADTQLIVPRVYKWAKKNSILYIPYIGVIESHSTNALVKRILDFLFVRNIRVYKKSSCCVKTPFVKKGLEEKGIKNSLVVPVGLDESCLNPDYDQADRNSLKEKYGFGKDDKIILYIGRMIEEKRPLKMIEIFRSLLDFNPNYKLLMVGKGPLLESTKELAIELPVTFINQIENRQVWELYRIADCFVNLNQQEIFGMAILEAMYYDCKVVAWEAPGPSSIISSGKNGWIVNSEERFIAQILDEKGLNSHQDVINHFLWESSASFFLDLIRKAA